ncbi:cold-regulated 413 plasma membrane protein 1-like [Rutidosis leptorrhynchoides]|uniref:cold-regulated 413 plasma membrane protein 1-like n=1 Tax=Rutidosis leptorrhynchoides TaxID=125765 RepID=UPI003A98EF99
MLKGAQSYLKMATDPALSEAASKLLSSDLNEIGIATKQFANHVIQLGVNGGLLTTILQWFAFFAAIYLLVLDKTNWRTRMLTSLLVPYIYLTFPNWLFGILRGDIGKWITFVGVVLRLFFPEHFKEYLLLPGSLILLVVVSPSFIAGYVRAGWIGVIICLAIGCYLLQEHIRAAGGFRNAFTRANGISNTIGIVLLFVFPVWALIGLI